MSAQGNTTAFSSEQESKYWASSAHFARRLSCSHARDDLGAIPLIPSYVPKFPLGNLKPGHSGSAAGTTQDDGTISPEVFCKWHWMVFPGPDHPTPAQSKLLLKNYSTRDLQEIARIAGLASSEQVFARGGAGAYKPRFQEMWDQWLENKGPDYVVVFA